MTDLTVKHKFVSAKADGPDTTLIRPSNWNDVHDLELTGPGVLGRVLAGAGPVIALDLATFFLPPGLLCPFAGPTIPSGWLQANGAAVSRTTYAALFAAIGTAYGAGDGATTFNLPDMRGRVAAGVDQMATGSAGRLTAPYVNVSNTIGAVGGSQSNTAVTNSSGVNTITVLAYTMDGPNTVTTSQPGIGQDHAGPDHRHGNLYSSGVNNIGVTGTSGAFSIVQPTLVTNYIIKF